MKVTFVNRMMGIARGGGETFDRGIASALQRLGHDVNFVVGRRVRRIDAPLTEFPTTYVATPYLRWMSYRYGSHPRKLVRGVAAGATLLDRFMFEAAAYQRIAHSDLARSDVFQVCGYPRIASWLERRLGKHSVVYWPGPPGQMLKKWILKYSANISFGTSLEDARRYDPAAHEIPPGIDTGVFRRRDPGGLRIKHGIPTDATVVLYVGRLIPVKNVSLLISAFVKALVNSPRLYLVLVGDGADGPRLRRQVSDLNLAERVLFAGARDTEEVAEFYGMADIFALSSTYESFGLVILEAMSSELPIVATRVGWIPMQVEDGTNGHLMESGDVNGLASAIVHLANHPEIRRQIGMANRRKIETYSDWTETGERLIAVYSAIMKR